MIMSQIFTSTILSWFGADAKAPKDHVIMEIISIVPGASQPENWDSYSCLCLWKSWYVCTHGQIRRTCSQPASILIGLCSCHTNRSKCHPAADEDDGQCISLHTWSSWCCGHGGMVPLLSPGRQYRTCLRVVPINRQGGCGIFFLLLSIIARGLLSRTLTLRCFQFALQDQRRKREQEPRARATSANCQQSVQDIWTELVQGQLQKGTVICEAPREEIVCAFFKYILSFLQNIQKD